MFKTSKNHNSVKIVLDFTGVLRLLGNNSVIPLLTAAKKRHFYPPKLPALRAEVDGQTQKSVRPFSCFLAAFSPRRPKSLDFARFGVFPHLPQAAFPAAISSCSDVFCQRSRTAAQRPVFRLPVGNTLDCVLKAAQTADTGATAWEWCFCCAFNPCFQ